jgi:putative transposase
MGIARSTYYGAPAADRDAEIVALIEAICAEFEAYGYRRVTAELRHQGQLVNSKRVRRLMREHGLSPKQRRRYVTTTDSDHDEPIFPNLAADMPPDRPNQLWVADNRPCCRAPFKNSISSARKAAVFVRLAMIRLMLRRLGPSR